MTRAISECLSPKRLRMNSDTYNEIHIFASMEALMHIAEFRSAPDLFIKEYPQWLDYIFRLYHKRFEELLDMDNAITFKKVDQRLIDLLQKKSELTASSAIHVTYEQLANELGTARVVVSRLLKQLEEQGAVQLGRNKIILKQESLP